jgi:preprotein translocase subunit SecB
LINNVSLLDRATHDEARKLIACAQLQSIRFVKFTLSLALQEDSSAEEVELSTSSKSTGKISATGMTLIFDLRVRGKSRERNVIDISGRVEAIYDLPDSEPPTEPQMNAFAKTNGMLNVWPYWREYVQSATLRAGLPPLTLPLFRVVHESGK